MDTSFDRNVLERMDVVKWCIQRHKDNKPLKGWKVLFIQHQLENHLALAMAMFELGLDKNNFFWIDIPYTSHQEIRDVLIAKGVSKDNFIVHNYRLGQTYQVYQRSRVCTWYKNFIATHSLDTPLLVLDDGAYFLEAMVCFKNRLRNVKIVEQTTRGLNKIKKNHAIKYYCEHVPVINVAKSRLKKEIEPIYIAEAVCEATFERTIAWIKQNNITNQSARVLILGYGSIGKAIATKFSADSRIENYTIYVYDSNSDKQDAAINDGYNTWEKSNKEIRFHIAVGCTGTRSFSIWDYVYLEKNALLISASSGSKEMSREAFVEFAETHKDDDIKVINKPVLESKNIHQDILLNIVDHRVTVVNGGFPVNFDHRLNRIPAENIQITMALMIEGALQAIQTKENWIIEFDAKTSELIEEEWRRINQDTAAE